MNTDPSPIQAMNESQQPIAQKPRVWTVFLALPSAMILGVLLTSIYVAIAGFILTENPRDTKRLVKTVTENSTAVIPSFALMGVALLFVTGVATALSPETFRNRLSLRNSSFRGRDYVASILMIYGVATISGQLLALFTDGDSPTLKLIQRQMQQSSLFMFVVAAAIIGGIGPIAEELFFRGYVQTRLRKRWGNAIAIIISAIAFGVFHLDLIQSIFAAAMGVALGYIAERSGSIYPAIVGHVFNNLVAVFISRFIQAPDDSSNRGNWMGVALGVLMLSGGLVALQKAPKPQATNDVP